MRAARKLGMVAEGERSYVIRSLKNNSGDSGVAGFGRGRGGRSTRCGPSHP